MRKRKKDWSLKDLRSRRRELFIRFDQRNEFLFLAKLNGICDCIANDPSDFVRIGITVDSRSKMDFFYTKYNYLKFDKI